MTDYHAIYANQAAAYHRLVMAEDADGNLLPALRRAAGGRLDGARVVEVGAGTGRVTAHLLEGGAAHVRATEPHAGMREEAARYLARFDAARWDVVEGAAAALPAAEGSADLVVAGWAIGHHVGWYPEAWPEHVDRALAEMRRVAGPDGRVVICETLGTGALTPGAPNDGLAAYYARLEERHGLVREAIATDYAFESPEEAAQVLGFFFGERLVARIRAEGWARVPEWTGVWSG